MAASRATASEMKVVNPATEEVLRELDEDDVTSVARKTAAARAAQPDWARTPLSKRIDAVRCFGELLTGRRDELASLLTSEMGKPIRHGKNELAAMQGRIDFFLEHTQSAIADEVVLRSSEPPAVEERIRYEPLGLVAN